MLYIMICTLYIIDGVVVLVLVEHSAVKYILMQWSSLLCLIIYHMWCK